VVPTRYDVDRDALAGLLPDGPRYRVTQVWDGLYRQLASPAELTAVPRALRDRLDDQLPAALAPVTEVIDRSGDTVKWLFGLDGGAYIETVLMHYRGRTTVCVSTQAGCAMACGFCAGADQPALPAQRAGRRVRRLPPGQRAVACPSSGR
jgi:23S rRNA (adenine2503-C2)-methyltransferase